MSDISNMALKNIGVVLLVILRVPKECSPFFHRETPAEPVRAAAVPDEVESEAAARWEAPCALANHRAGSSSGDRFQSVLGV